MIDRANGLNPFHQNGQWLDEQQAAGFWVNIVKDKKGVFSIKLPADIKARVFSPKGEELIPDMAKVVMKPDGSIRTAYPFSSISNYPME